MPRVPGPPRCESPVAGGTQVHSQLPAASLGSMHACDDAVQSCANCAHSPLCGQNDTGPLTALPPSP
eukprot:gene2030-biopygen4883